MLRFFIVSVALSSLPLGTALAQRGAPIVQGATTADIAAQNAQLQQQNAELRVQISELVSDIAQLTGKVETLEFLLGQSRDEINRMQGDDAQIGEILQEYERKFTELDRRLESLNERVANAGTQSQGLVTNGGPTRTITIRNPDGTVSTKVVELTESSAENALGVEGDAQPSEITITETTEATAEGAGPGQTGYLGTISAADLPGEAGALFEEAKSRLLQFDYVGAEVAFRAFLSEFGEDPQAGEAQYWLGEVLHQQEQYAASGSAYTEMISKYPDDSRAPDALVKLARSMRLVGETTRACAALDALPLRYPNAPDLTINLAAVERTRSECDV